MPLLFHDFCTLLSDIESYCAHVPPLLPVTLQQKVRDRTRQWFQGHKVTIDSPGVDPVALLSALFPEKRTDRVYSLKAQSLSRRLRGCLCLGNGRWQLLDQWKTPGHGDLGDCVERALKQSEFPKQTPENEVTLDQVDAALARLAARNRFSGPDVRESKENDDPKDVDRILERIYRRLQSREAKWFTRILVKDLGSLELPLPMVLACLHPDLPQYIKVYDNFEGAISMLRGRGVPSLLREGYNDRILRHTNITGILTPKVGVKLGRTKYIVGRSVKHAVKMIGRQKMSVERKYDGEYCQVHIDVSAGENWIKIFSKSGKDSTADRAGLHHSIKDSLRIGRQDCGFSGKCILEGELVVWSDREKDILDFCKIRKHVSRSGSFLGTTFDSQPHDFEHLMIMFYDVMLVDSDPIINQSHTRRRRLLKKLITPIPGRAGVAVRDIIDLSSPNGPSQLQQALARTFAMRWEGLVLKPCDEPYFSARKPSPGQYPSCWIKIKKDYIKGLGDTADFAVVGAGYDVNEAKMFGGLNPNWTHFHIGCLNNKEEVLQHDAKPKFTVIDALNLCIKREDIKTLNQLGQFRAVDVGSWGEAAAYGMILEQGVPNMSVAFKDPFVFEVMGAGFDKQPNRTAFSLRFPRVLKVHWDRDWKEAVTVDELQEMASVAKLVPSDDLANDVSQWVEQLKKVDRGAKGVMAPWENSQEDEKETEEVHIPQTARNARRGRSKSEAPPMIRMDTKDISKSEYRAEDGRVLQRPTSRQSQSSVATESTLPTPPASSPFGAALDSVARKHFSASLTTEPSRDGRKRKIDETASGEVTSSDEATQFKKARRFFEAQTKLSDQPSTIGCTMAPVQPLQNLTNSARPRDTPLIKPARRRSGRSSTPESFLVRKIPVGALEAAYLQPRQIFQPSSPARETTASEYTSQGTSQLTMTPAAVAGPPYSPTKEATPTPIPNDPQPPGIRLSICLGSKESDLPMSETTPMPTPSNPETPMDILIPDFKHSQIYLSPCIANTPYITHNLLLDLGIASLPYLSENLPSSPTLPPTPASTAPSLPTTSNSPILILVESRRKEATLDVFKALALDASRWPPGRSVDIWDWRLLELFRYGRPEGLLGAGNEEDEEAREWFLGSMRWDDEAGEIEVRWRDGGVSRGELPTHEGEGVGEGG